MCNIWCNCFGFCILYVFSVLWRLRSTKSKPKLQSLLLRETLVCLRFWSAYVHHCLIIQHGVSGGTRLRLPWCTAPLCSAVWEQRAALSASLVPLGSLPQRQGLTLFPFLSFRPLSLFHSLFNTHWALLSTSFAPLSVVRCLKPSLLISQRNSPSLARSRSTPCPRFQKCQTTPRFLFSLWLPHSSEFLWSPS